MRAGKAEGAEGEWERKREKRDGGCRLARKMGKTNKRVKKFAQKGGIRSKVQKQHGKRAVSHKHDRRRGIVRKGEVRAKRKIDEEEEQANTKKGNNLPTKAIEINIQRPAFK